MHTMFECSLATDFVVGLGKDIWMTQRTKKTAARHPFDVHIDAMGQSNSIASRAGPLAPSSPKAADQALLDFAG
jgi:hypothetical protein